METKDKEIENIPTYDFSESEQALIDDFIKRDCPSYSNVRNDKKDKWYRLYQTGKTYSDIASITKSKVELVLYASFKLRWTDKRTSYYADLANSALANVKNIHSQSVKTMSTIVSAFSLYFEEKFGKYISTKDGSLIEDVDPKILTQYYKSLDVMSKMIGGKDSSKLKININNNVPKTATSVKSGKEDSEDVFEVEFDENTSGDMLKNLASKE